MMSNQGNLFPNITSNDKIGHADVEFSSSSTILTIPTGFMESYDFSLNPYSGCTFGCTYCYAAFFSKDKVKMDNWGYWVKVKENALSILKKKRSKPIIDKIVYMSSVTDPYQTIEKKLRITRNLLQEFSDYHKIRLVVQTRSSLVTRDIDLFKKINRVQINMTVTTDDEKVRKIFEPYCPSNKKRLDAIEKINNAGIQSCITMTPLLPVKNPHIFAKDLKSTGIENFIIQPFHKSKGRFIAGTRESALEILNNYNWNKSTYQKVFKIIKGEIPNIGVGKDGFAPPI